MDDPCQYFVVPKCDLEFIQDTFDESRIIQDAKFVLVISDDLKKVSNLNVVLDWRMDSWADWKFAVYARGKKVADGRFREKADRGDEDNHLDGDLDLAAELLEVDADGLRAVLETDEPNVYDFMDYVGYPDYKLTPAEMDEAIASRGKKKRSKKAEQYDPWPREVFVKKKPRRPKPTKKAAKRRRKS